MWLSHQPQQTAGFQSFTKSYVAFRSTHFLSTSNDSWDSSWLLLRDKFCVTFTKVLICTSFLFSGKFCVDYVVESYSAWKWWHFNICKHKFRMKERIRKRPKFHALLRVLHFSFYPLVSKFHSASVGCQIIYVSLITTVCFQIQSIRLNVKLLINLYSIFICS